MKSLHWHRILRLSLVAIHAGLILYGAAIHSACMDEPGHLASGVLNLQTGNYEPYRVNPPLYRQLAGAFVAAGHYVPVPDSFAAVVDPTYRSEWHAGRSFAESNAESYRSILFRGRIAGAVWSCLGLWLAMAWARVLGGAAAGWIAGIIWCFEPNLIAHAQLVGPDIPAAAAGLWAVWLARAYYRDPDWAGAILAGIGLGVALLTKFTLLLLIPVWAVGMWLATGSNLAFWQRYRIRTFHLLAAGGLALLMVHAGYEFSKIGEPLGSLKFISTAFSGEPEPGMVGNRFRETPLANVPLPLPADYLLGMDVQRRDFEFGRTSFSSYLRGETKAGGWWYYYLYGLGVKVPIGFLCLMIGGYGWGLWSFVRGPRMEACLLLAPATLVLAAVSSQTGFNHHVRYVMPALPFLIVTAGAFAARWMAHARWGFVAVILLCLWGAGSSLRYYPHCLSYFNEFAGGPEKGSDHLIDSNIDWGQDLTMLKKWEDAHPEARPLHYGLFTPLPTEIWGLTGGPANAVSGLSPEDVNRPLPPGWYAISVTFFKSRRLRPAVRSYLETLTPIGRVGYSIWIYRVDGNEQDSP